MTNLQVKIEGTAQLRKAADAAGKKFRRELAIVINKVAQKTKSLAAKKIGKTITLPQKNIKRLISVPGKANAGMLGATVKVKGTKRINLKFFKARQTKKGVTTKIYRAKAPQVDVSAFKVGRWGGNVVRRLGKQRGPLKTITGPAAAEVFSEELLAGTTQETEAELRKQITERIRFLKLKASGAI